MSSGSTAVGLSAYRCRIAHALIFHSTSRNTIPSAGSAIIAARPLGPSAARKAGE